MGIFLGATGCNQGPARVSVAGKVTLDAKPLPTGTITFIPVGNGIAAQADIRDGQYTIPAASGPTTGEFKVEVLSSQPTGKKIAGPSSDDSGMTTEMKQVVPTKYNSQSKLRQTFQPGENTFNVEMTTN
jgi:hypothetical protein